MSDNQLLGMRMPNKLKVNSVHLKIVFIFSCNPQQSCILLKLIILEISAAMLAHQIRSLSKTKKKGTQLSNISQHTQVSLTSKRVHDLTALSVAEKVTGIIFPP